jgi:hypothetical protein
MSSSTLIVPYVLFILCNLFAHFFMNAISFSFVLFSHMQIPIMFILMPIYPCKLKFFLRFLPKIYSLVRVVLTPMHNGFTQTAQSPSNLSRTPKPRFSGPSQSRWASGPDPHSYSFFRTTQPHENTVNHYLNLYVYYVCCLLAGNIFFHSFHFISRGLRNLARKFTVVFREISAKFLNRLSRHFVKIKQINNAK